MPISRICYFSSNTTTLPVFDFFLLKLGNLEEVLPFFIDCYILVLDVFSREFV